MTNYVLCGNTTGILTANTAIKFCSLIKTGSSHCKLCTGSEVCCPRYLVGFVWIARWTWKQVWVQSPNLFSMSSRSALMHRPMRLQLDAVSVTNRLYRHCTIHQTDRRQTCLSLCLYQYPLCCVSWHRNAATRLTIILCVGWSQSDFLLPSSFLLCRFVPAQERLVFALPIASCDSRPDE